MKRLVNILIVMMALLPLASCHDQPEWKNDPYGNFDALWTILDEHYCFFAYKNVDWQEVRQRYRAKIHGGISSRELFDLCSDMLKELQDGHTNLISTFDVSRYWIWEQYPINYDERLIDEHYLHFDYRRASGIKYQILSNNFAYVYYGDFANGIGDGNLDVILNGVATSDGLVIDVRNNGGGYLTNVETLVGRFIDERTYAGSIQHKNGTGHNDFSEPYDYYFEPARGRVHYNKPVVVLANRGSFSATNNFVSIMKSLPNVTVVGDVTGGGCGLPFNSELPNGWSVRFSSAPITGPDGKLTEFGVEPDVKVDMTEADAALGKDTILETAFEILKKKRNN
ncbi:MAG: S41 family peptidase [Muribaculaceae bacterium]|nr:S41 family peptidase [Muribaculaceae bacterium]